jgi:hypothetical protein
MHIKKRGFSGKLLIDGNLEDNCIMFRFLFDEPEMIHPLLIRVKAMPLVSPGKRSGCGRGRARIITFICGIPDSRNPAMTTTLVFPGFALKKHLLKVIKIESQVSCKFRDFFTYP